MEEGRYGRKMSHTGSPVTAGGKAQGSKDGAGMVTAAV